MPRAPAFTRSKTSLISLQIARLPTRLRPRSGMRVDSGVNAVRHAAGTALRRHVPPAHAAICCPRLCARLPGSGSSEDIGRVAPREACASGAVVRFGSVVVAMWLLANSSASDGWRKLLILWSE
jgi:hypothetical protein